MLLDPYDEPLLPDAPVEDEVLFEEPNDELLFWLPVPELVLFDDPNDDDPVFEVLLSFAPEDDVLLFDDELFDDELFDDELFDDELFDDELLLDEFEELLFDEPLFDVFPVGVEPKLDELLLPLLLALLTLASVLRDEPVLVVLYSLSELLPPLFDQPEFGDSSDDEELRPLPLPLLIETTLTWVSRRVSSPSSDESLLKLIPLEFNPVLPGGRDRLVLRLAGLMMELFDLMFSCLSSMTLNP